MSGAENPASIPILISIGTSLLAGFFSVLVGVRSCRGAAAPRDTAVTTLFGIALVLILLNVFAAALIAVRGMAYSGPAKITLLLTAAFAVAGMACGLMRGLRSGRAIKTPCA